MTTIEVRAGGIRPAGWAGPAAVLGCAAYGVLALLWTITGRGYPFGANDPEERFALLHHVPVAVGAPLFAGVLLTAAVLALAMAGRHAVHLRGAPRLALLGAGWAIVAGLLVGVPTVTVLAVTGYAPMLILGAPFGWPHGIHYGEVFDWSLLNQALCLGIGFLLARTVLGWQRRSRGACAACGRPAGPPTGRGSARALRVGRWAVGVAVVVPLLYTVVRYAWVLDVPLLIHRDNLRELRAEGGHWIGAGLGTFAAVGAVLTLGLVQHWGEVFPRWLPVLRGRPVPVRLAVVPAGFVAVVVLAGTLGPVVSPQFWRLHPVEAAPLALMPLWAVALGVAAAAYRVRRRGSCAECGATQ